MSEWIWEDKVPRYETSYVFPILMLIIFLYDAFFADFWALWTFHRLEKAEERKSGKVEL